MKLMPNRRAARVTAPAAFVVSSGAGTRWGS
jgi:hypothetical protein